jgi:hypothetical protein
LAYVDVKSVYGTTIKQYYIGASTDSKPTDVQVGARFIESDTQTTYIFSSDRTWVIDPEHQALNKTWNPDTLEWERMTQPIVNISNASLFVELGSMDAQFQSMNSQLASMVSTLDAGLTVNMGSVTSAISAMTSVQISTMSILASVVSLITIQNSGVVSNNSQMASLITIADATSTRVGAISTTLGAISTRVGAISTTLNNISTIGGNISNVLSGISARLSIMSTAIGSINVLLASMELHFDPLAKFGIGFVDDTSATSYYGYQDRAGAWYALRISNGSYLYYYNSADFDTGWGSRATLSYNSFAGTF